MQQRRPERRELSRDRRARPVKSDELSEYGVTSDPRAVWRVTDGMNTTYRMTHEQAVMFAYVHNLLAGYDVEVSSLRTRGVA